MKTEENETPAEEPAADSERWRISLEEADRAAREAQRPISESFWAGVRRTAREAIDYKTLAKTPYGLRPLLLMALLTAVAGFDGSILGLALPEIIRDLDIQVPPLINALNILGFLLVFGGIGLAYVADRRRRVPMVGLGAIITGVFSVATTFVRSLFGMGFVRSGDAIGQTALGTPISALIADWYPVHMWGRAIAISRVLRRTAAFVSPLIILWLLKVSTTDPSEPNWRFPYLISGPALILSGILVILLLREPVRGYMERRYVGVPEEEARETEAPPSFGESWRIIWSIRTLRRLFIADVVTSPGLRAFGIFITLFFFQFYHLDIQDRAGITAVLGLGSIPGALLAGGVIDSLVRRAPHRVLVLSAMIGLAGSLFLMIDVLALPPLWVVVAFGLLFFFFDGMVEPAFDVLYLQILPAHVRTLGTSMRLLAQVPGTLVFALTISTVFARFGVRGALLAASILFVVGSVIQITAAPLFERDLRAARAAATATREWREAKARGRSKLLVCRDVDVEYDGVQVLFGVDFDVDEGDLIALLGTNGAGKSTLLKAIAGSHVVSSGAIVFDGRDTTFMPPHEQALRGIVLMPGGRGIFSGLTVKENLGLALWSAEDGDTKSRLEEVYSLFPILKERADERAGLLSGGEQQMLSLGQVLLSKPRLLMIDELSLGLSPAVVQQLIEVVKAIHAGGTTIILVEQSVNVALTIAERAIFMEKGEVKFVGKTQDLLARPDILRAVYVKGTGALTEVPTSAIKGERERRQYQLQEARPILEVSELTKSFGGIQAVSHVSFGLREGEILGLIGPNGAGKTTIFDLITGYQIPDSGRVVLDGTDVSQLSPDERARMRLVRRFQDARLFPALSVYENILVALERKLEVRSVVLTALQMPQARQAERRVRRRADRLIDLLELGAYRDKFVKELSTGLRRISDIACILAADPKVLLLDEPSTGIAQAESEMLAPLLRRVRFETGCSMLIIEHDMPLISAISDELIALDQGAVITRGRPDEVLNDERVIESYLGGAEEVIQRTGTRTLPKK